MEDDERRALTAAAERVGDRWTLLLVHALLDGSRRFGQLQDHVGGIAPNVLTQRLRALEADGLVVAEPYSRRPLRYEYGLTQRGRDLAGVLRLLAAWEADGLGPRHAVCGSHLDVRWWCRTCDRPVDAADDDLVRL